MTAFLRFVGISLICNAQVVAGQQGISYVLEPFEAIDEKWLTFAYKEGSFNVSLVQDEALFGKSALQVSYEVVQTEVWGGFVDLRYFSDPSYNCVGATHLSLWYKILKSQTAPGRAHLRINLLDDSEDYDGEALGIDTWESYYSFHDILDESDQESDWQEIRIELEGSEDPSSPFWRTGWSGQVGNGVLDLSHIKGWRLEISIDGELGLGQSSEGALLFDQLSCVGGEALFGAAFQYEDGFDEAVKEKVWGLWIPSYSQSEISQDLTTVGLVDGRMSVNYAVTQTETWGGMIDVQHIAPGPSYYNLTEANDIRFNYFVKRAADPQDRVELRAILLDSSNCSGTCDLVGDLEHYFSFHRVLDEVGYDEILLPLVGDREQSSPFWLTEWTGVSGNGLLDKAHIKGFRFEFSANSHGALGSVVSGECELSHWAATLENVNATNGASNLIRYSVAEPDLMFYTDSLFVQEKRFSITDCYQVCLEDPTCLYYQISTHNCHYASYLEPSSIGFFDSGFKKSNFEAFWMSDEQSRGDFCHLCTCEEKDLTIDCRGKDLLTVPKTMTLPSSDDPWEPRVLDLRNNSRLLLLGTGSLDEVPTLEELCLPRNMAYISPETVSRLPLLTKVLYEDTEMDYLSNVITESNEAFGNVCCCRGEQVLPGGSPTNAMTFCNMDLRQPGYDSTYEPSVEYYEAEQLDIITPLSPFMKEAAESYFHCAEYCAYRPDCMYFSYDGRLDNEEPTCALLATKGTPRWHVPGADESKTSYTSGRPPQNRNEAHLVFSAQNIVLDQSTGYKSNWEVSLGAMPLVGSVWVEPHVREDSGLDVSFNPRQIVLYDNVTTVTIEVSLLNAQALSTSGRFPVQMSIESCDRAFMRTSKSLQQELEVIIPNTTRSLTTIMLAVSAIFVIGCAGCLLLYRDHRHKQLDSLWKVSASEITFENPDVVIGHGTFGEVLLAEYRGTKVAVKRVIPPRQQPQSFENESSFDILSKIRKEARKERQDRRTGFNDPELKWTNKEEERSQNDASLLSNLPSSTIWNSSGAGFTSQNLGMKTTKGAPQKRERGFQFWKDEYSVLNDEFVMEMRHLAKLRHPCITTIMGAMVCKEKAPMLVMEYMDHGSLYDLLHNDTMPLEGEYVLPILQDIAKGVRFLHATTPQLIHGDLKAQNILVDGKFRAKVTDFGISRKSQFGVTGTPYWMAPELLRGEGPNSAESDVYSFGIILYEVYSRQDPYDGEDFKEVIGLVADPLECKRPQVPESCPGEIKCLMTSCLDASPGKRPTFDDLDIGLHILDADTIGPGDTAMTSRVKKYRKTNDLLHAVLPPHIAQALMDGKKVQPESHSLVTIFFSDIVGFTTLASELSPMKVSDMIDRLYVKFDSLSQQHGVFKLETIGDAWMGACNLIEKQDDDHVKRIAEFSIDVLKAAGETLIDLENPERGYVQIRVGFHSGPVVANVVGSITPKYCLFGDAVNTAARMESNSKTNRIHCSAASAILLSKQCPAIKTYSRGLVEVKGKGVMHTYWVNENFGGLKKRAARQLRRLSEGHVRFPMANQSAGEH